MNRQNKPQTVFLDEYHSRPFVISPEALVQITAIVTAHRVCQVCAQAYSQVNPMVVLNTCLRCFMQSETVKREKKLEFLGADGLDSSGDMYYVFMDADGYIIRTDSGQASQSLKKDVYKTLLYWKFTVPQRITHNGREKDLETSYWYVYGVFRYDSVVVLKYHEDYGAHLETAFFAFKNGPTIEINKRRKAVQQVFKQARTDVEATRDVEGRYTYAYGRTTYQLEDQYLYYRVAEILSGQYDRTGETIETH